MKPQSLVIPRKTYKSYWLGTLDMRLWTNWQCNKVQEWMTVEVKGIPGSPRVRFLVAGLLGRNREQKIRAQKLPLGGEVFMSIGMPQPVPVIFFINANWIDFTVNIPKPNYTLTINDEPQRWKQVKRTQASLPLSHLSGNQTTHSLQNQNSIWIAATRHDNNEQKWRKKNSLACLIKTWALVNGRKKCNGDCNIE